MRAVAGRMLGDERVIIIKQLRLKPKLLELGLSLTYRRTAYTCDIAILIPFSLVHFLLYLEIDIFFIASYSFFHHSNSLYFMLLTILFHFSFSPRPHPIILHIIKKHFYSNISLKSSPSSFFFLPHTLVLLSFHILMCSF